MVYLKTGVEKEGTEMVETSSVGCRRDAWAGADEKQSGEEKAEAP